VGTTAQAAAVLFPFLQGQPLSSATAANPQMATHEARIERLDQTVYVADLPVKTTYQDLVECFEKFGSTQIVIKR
jgi:hypothetical protein